MENEINRTKGIHILVEAVREGQSDCQVVVLDNGQRHIYLEPMQFEEAVAVADEVKEMMGLPPECAVVMRSALLTNYLTSLIARAALEVSNEQMIKH